MHVMIPCISNRDNEDDEEDEKCCFLVKRSKILLVRAGTVTLELCWKKDV